MTKSGSGSYDVHPSVAYAQAIVANLPAKTGRSMVEWVKLVKAASLSADKERREWLKREHGIGGTTARMVVDRAAGRGATDTDEQAYLKAAPGYVDGMYAGGKAALRPIHDALVELGRSLGEDVKVCPCETIVPLYREHVFAQIKPSTRTRVDFGLALKGTKKKIPARLIATGGLERGDRITHRLALESVDDIDAVVQAWLAEAYALDA